MTHTDPSPSPAEDWAENVRLNGRVDQLETQPQLDQQLIASLRKEVTARELTIERLESALVTARRIGTAVGIVMATLETIDEQPFTVLTTRSQATNRRVRDIAAQVIFNGELP